MSVLWNYSLISAIIRRATLDLPNERERVRLAREAVPLDVMPALGLDVHETLPPGQPPSNERVRDVWASLGEARQDAVIEALRQVPGRPEVSARLAQEDAIRASAAEHRERREEKRQERG